MKGIMFNLLEEIVSKEYGLDTWDAILSDTNTAGIYSSIGSYSDEQLFKLLEATSSRLDIPENEILCWYGRSSFPFLSKTFENLIKNYKDVQSFLLSLNDIIHPEVKKLYPGASVPLFEYEKISENDLLLIYRSEKKMCKLGEGLIEGAAAYYDTAVNIYQSECMLHGDQCCRIHVQCR